MYLLLTGFWLIFFVAHSLLAASPVKGWVYQNFKSATAWYRIVYNLIAILLLAPIVYTLWLLPSNALWQQNSVILLCGVAIVAFGIFVLYDSFKAYHSGEFFGFYQLKTRQEYKPEQFNATGWNSIVRHPLYFGTILIAVGIVLALPDLKWLLSSAKVVLYTFVGTLLEEQKLVKTFGQTYLNYQKEVPMLFPRKFWRKRG